MAGKYFHQARALYNWLDDKRIFGPAELHHVLVMNLGATLAPSYSQCKMVLRGEREFPPYVILFMMDRLSFRLKWEDALPATDREGNVRKEDSAQTVMTFRQGRSAELSKRFAPKTVRRS